MAKSDYVPRKDSNMLAWHDQFKNALASVGPGLGIPAGDITAVTADNSGLHTKVQSVTTTAAAAKAAVKDKDAARIAAESRVRRVARFAKALPGYNESIGQTLGIVGHERRVDLRTTKPQLRGRDRGAGKVRINYKKLTSDGVNIYSQRGAEETFTLLCRDVEPPFTDERALLVPGTPEVRQYRCVFVVKDAEIGGWSDVLAITCGP